MAQTYYEIRRVTRDTLQNFLREQPVSEEARTQLDLIRKEHLQDLLDLGNGVCRIDIRGVAEGTGFHLGNGWVLSNQHVLCGEDENNSNAHLASFQFPGLDIIEPKPRKVIFSHFQDDDNQLALQDSRKDLALVHLPEIVPLNLKALGNPFQHQGAPRQRVFLIHFGDGLQNLPVSQQFSIADGFICFNLKNKNDNCFSVHTAHSRPGASGAPLLAYGEREGFRVCGVHFAGPEEADFIDSPGYALWFHRDHWLQKTVYPAGEIDVMYRYEDMPDIVGQKADEEANKVCKLLQDYLVLYYLRVRIPCRPPRRVNRIEFPNIIWD